MGASENGVHPFGGSHNKDSTILGYKGYPLNFLENTQIEPDFVRRSWCMSRNERMPRLPSAFTSPGFWAPG